MASSSNRTEYADKTLAKNAMVDRKLKLRISNLDTAKSICQRELAREEKALRQELHSSRRMSCNNSPQMRYSSKRRASNPVKCMSEDVSTVSRLQLPSTSTIRRRSLPDINTVVLPSIPNNKSLTALRQNDGEQSSTRASTRRCSEISTNLSLSQMQTPSLSPRPSISSLVSSLSNSTNRLPTLNDSEETFDRVRQFLQRLEESKLRSDSQSSGKESEDEGN